MDDKLRIFADLYARYHAAHIRWFADTGDQEGPWRQAMDGLLGYAATEHGIASKAIRQAARQVEL